MLDIKVIRNDPERVKQAMKNRNADRDAKIDEIRNGFTEWLEEQSD